MMTLHASTIARLLGACIIVLALASTLVLALAIHTGKDTIYGLVGFLWLDAEANLPTWYASVLLLFSAALLAVIAQAESTDGTRRRHWLGLSVLFLYLSADEASTIHEKFIRPLKEVFGMEAWAYFVWTIPFGALLTVLAVAYARWFFSLPPRMRALTLAAAALYVGGAMGLEIAGALITGGNRASVEYLAISTMEETLEMCGVVLWIYALIDYGAARGIRVEVRLTS